MGVVKRLINNQWTATGLETPVSTPINIGKIYPKYFVTSNLGIYPNSNNFVSVGSITIPKTGTYVCEWHVSCSESNYSTTYALYKNGTQILTGSSHDDDFSYEVECDENDTLSMSYKSAQYNDGYSTYYIGFGSALIVHEKE